LKNYLIDCSNVMCIGSTKDKYEIVTWYHCFPGCLVQPRPWSENLLLIHPLIFIYIAARDVNLQWKGETSWIVVSSRILHHYSISSFLQFDLYIQQSYDLEEDHCRNTEKQRQPGI
jgi:hypothetical protein